jgi:hypothetical protein
LPAQNDVHNDEQVQDHQDDPRIPANDEEVDVLPSGQPDNDVDMADPDQPMEVRQASPEQPRLLGSPIRLTEKPADASQASRAGKSKTSRATTQEEAIEVSTDDSEGEPEVTPPKTKPSGSSAAKRSRPKKLTKSRARVQEAVEVSSNTSETEGESDDPRSSTTARKSGKGKTTAGPLVLGTKHILKSTMQGSLDSTIKAPIDLLNMIAIPVCNCSH